MFIQLKNFKFLLRVFSAGKANCAGPAQGGRVGSMGVGPLPPQARIGLGWRWWLFPPMPSMRGPIDLAAHLRWSIRVYASLFMIGGAFIATTWTWHAAWLALTLLNGAD